MTANSNSQASTASPPCSSPAATLVVKGMKFKVLPGREKIKTSTEGAEERDADVKEGVEKKEEGFKVHFAGEWNCRGCNGWRPPSQQLEVLRV